MKKFLSMSMLLLMLSPSFALPPPQALRETKELRECPANHCIESAKCYCRAPKTMNCTSTDSSGICTCYKCY